MTRNILNYLGQVVGTLSMPDDTAESEWERLLAPYAQPPVQPALSDIISKRIMDYEKMSAQLLREIKVTNTLNGLSVQQSAQMFSDFGDIIQMVREGSYPTALYALSQKTPSGAVTQEVLDAWITKIKEYV